MKERFQSEQELAAVVVGWLQADSWTVYQEVQIARYSSVADIVAVRDPVVMVIECKLRFGIEVIEQAAGWTGLAHYVGVASPTIRSDRANRCLQFLCQHFGIGVMYVPPDARGLTASLSWSHHIGPPKLHRKAKVDILRAGLREEQKSWAEAGNSRGLRFTPFASTCKSLMNVVAKQPGIEMREAVASIKHHYASDQSARSSLLKWIEAGHVAGIRLRRDGKKLLLEPARDIQV